MHFQFKRTLFSLLLLVCVIIGSVLLSNCQITKNIQTNFSYNPFSIDNTGNAVILGVKNPDTSDIKPYYVHIPDSKVLEFEGVDKSHGGGWIPFRNQPYVIAVDENDSFSLKIFQYKENVLKEVKTILFPNMFVTFPTWNPAGNILAARVFIFNGELQEAKLGLSFDDGNNFDVTKWKFGIVVWETTDKLWMNSGNKLLELSIKDGKAHLENEITFSEGAHPGVIGVSGKEPVYSLGNEIYRGNTVLYSGSECGDAMVDDQLILVWEADLNKITLLDFSGKIIHTRLLKEGMWPKGFSSKSKRIFLDENQRILSMYNFEMDSPIQRLVDINSFH
jgi:hypothetical protein